MNNQSLRIANLSEEDLKKIKDLEQKLNHGTDISKILIAYDK